MQGHSRYEELCAAAAVGQITTEELNDLQAHLKLCTFCTDLQAQFMEINSVFLAQAQNVEPDLYDPYSVLRKSILRKLEGAGAKFSAPVHKEIAAGPKKLPPFGFPRPGTSQISVLATLVVALALAVGVGYWRNSSSASKQSIAHAISLPAEQTPALPADAVASHGDNASSSPPAGTASDLKQRTAAAEARNLRLENQIRDLTHQIADLRQAHDLDTTSLTALKADGDQDHAAALKAQMQLRALKETEASKDAELVSAQYRLRDLEDKLAQQAARTERDRELAQVASSSDMRDVIGSRSLHIIDVADVDNAGVRKPFGRIFYTEGKSLIFYAYDLSNTKGKQTFFAWGHKEGDPRLTQALGALVNDDQAQRRWVFRFNNTKVLAEIDSVSVTLEPNDDPGDKPKGKKLLNAYLGTPANHP